MSGDTAIEWTDASWNPTTGCDKVSPGCDHCYAMTLAKRLKGMGSRPYQEDGDPRTSGPGFLAHEWPAALEWPLHKTKPLRIFVNSMSDLFHKNITDDYIAKVFAVMALCPQHSFQVLTKRHARMRLLLSSVEFQERVWSHLGVSTERQPKLGHFRTWPTPNVWLGVSVDSQQWADIRIPALLDTPAAVRFLSCEPLLGPLELWGNSYLARDEFDRGTDWVIAGGESGPGARPMHPDWARSLRDQCVAAGVPFLFKQWGEHVTRDQMTEAAAANWDIAHGSDVYHESVPWRVGKKAAGRELDGRTWDEYPTVAVPA